MLKVEADYNKETVKVEAQGALISMSKELLVVVRGVYDAIKANFGKDAAESARGAWMYLFADDEYWETPAFHEKGDHT